MELSKGLKGKEDKVSNLIVKALSSVKKLEAEDYNFFWEYQTALIEYSDQVFDKMKLLRIQTTQYNPKVLEIRTEHRQVYNAILQRNTKQAIDLITKHLRASKKRVVKELENINSKSLDF